MKKSALLPITLIVFIDVLGFTVVIPLLPFYAQSLGASPAAVGALIATYAVFALFTGPLLGRASDRFGRKPVLLFSQAGSLLGFVMLAIAPSLTWLFIGRALDGLSAGNLLAARAYISDVTPPKDRSAAFGLIAAAFGFGYLVGPAGSSLLSVFGPHTPLWTAAALAATSIVVTMLMLPSTRPTATAAPPIRTAELIATPGVAPRLAQWFAFLAAFGMFTSGFALFSERRFTWNGAPFGAVEVGFALAWLGALGLVVQLLVLRRLVDRCGEAQVVRIGFAVAAAGYAVLAVAQDLPLLVIALSLSGIATSLLRPALLGLISNAVPATRQGMVFGVTQSLQAITLIVSPLAAGALIHVGWLTSWALGCSAILIAGMFAGPKHP
ncbi:DHA1 family tetracycline resistance protein-like MFS transporter [Panacagrimonas perspica]|uniref:DHA1 family tetracycline resistance protein-like MFS transporter n=1 Tax=Panacagrimonas perspica TaxID=381431 RepID=A0A4S3K5Z2_9GAMM|nr:MFS transporter [Panacagrimonas perspica]TDU26781.1 DHA1 family tetracycline resistance protein-like MFS transporter [Panacagrimonas perspica]THD03565.1 hypothetical protein B1810_08395 [Panacagrimonas perspica]